MHFLLINKCLIFPTSIHFSGTCGRAKNMVYISSPQHFWLDRPTGGSMVLCSRQARMPTAGVSGAAYMCVLAYHLHDPVPNRPWPDSGLRPGGCGPVVYITPAQPKVVIYLQILLTVIPYTLTVKIQPNAFLVELRN